MPMTIYIRHTMLRLTDGFCNVQSEGRQYQEIKAVFTESKGQQNKKGKGWQMKYTVPLGGGLDLVMMSVGELYISSTPLVELYLLY